jgi:prepilin-type processing-associated H-X9-DG protein
MKSSGESTLSVLPERRTIAAFTLAELMAIIAVVAFTALLMLPSLFVHDGCKPMRFKCVSNLKQVGLAFRVWEGDNNDRYPMRVLTNSFGGPLYTDSSNAFYYFQIMSNELSNPQILVCPEDKKHRPATNFTTDFNGSRISYFVGLGADETLPQLFLAGDSHLTNGQPLRNGILELTTNHPAGWTQERHQGLGNVAMADGSVQQFSSSALRMAIQSSGLTNRLLMPK